MPITKDIDFTSVHTARLQCQANAVALLESAGEDIIEPANERRHAALVWATLAVSCNG